MKPVLPEGYSVKYYHQRNIDLADGSVSPKGGQTIAKVEANGRLVAQGEAYCHPKDNFNRRVGRTIALGRALDFMLCQGATQAQDGPREDPIPSFKLDASEVSSIVVALELVTLALQRASARALADG